MDGYVYPPPELLEPLTDEELEALLWLGRNVSWKALRDGPYRPQPDRVGHGALSTATNKIEAQLHMRVRGQS